MEIKGSFSDQPSLLSSGIVDSKNSDDDDDNALIKAMDEALTKRHQMQQMSTTPSFKASTFDSLVSPLHDDMIL